MSETLRGADIVAQSLKRLGCRRVFTLSGNHIMSIFDAALDSGLDLVHVRHEAAAVHMADAHGRLTGEAGIALVTGGPGHANAVGALFTALGAESPVVLLSGHAATWELGRGGFQELAQAEMARPVTKASWTSASTETLGRDLGEAIRIATSGRPGPVHLSLPSDLLDARIADSTVVWPKPEAAQPAPLADGMADKILAAVASAARPVIIAGPRMSTVPGRALLAKLEAATGAPAVIMESPRGIADATLGAFADLIKRADLIVLLGKALDFTTKWAAGPAFAPEVRVISIDPDEALVARAKKEKGERLTIGTVADSANAAKVLTARAGKSASRPFFAQGQPADAVFYIQEGKVKVCVLSAQGKEAVVALHGPGDFFGEGCLTGQQLRLATVAAVTECVIMRLDKASIVRVLRDEPKFSEMFMSYVLARNARVEEDLVDQLFNSSEKRLARTLLLMANFAKEGKPEPIMAVSQETLAEMIGTTRSRVSTFMNKFRKLGFIEYNGELKVHNSLLNVVLHDNPHLRRKEAKPS